MFGKKPLPQSQLFRLAIGKAIQAKWSNEEYDRPLAHQAVERITDPILLQQVAAAEIDTRVRIAALATLAERLQKNPRLLRNAALNQSSLAKLVIKCPKDALWLRRQYVDNLDDTSAMEILALEDSEADIRWVASIRLGALLVNNKTTEDRLCDLAVHPADGVRLAAIAKLRTQPILVQLWRTDQSPRVSSAAHERLLRLREASISELTDEFTLDRVLLDETDPRLRLAAVQRITSASTLEGVAAADADPRVRLAAIHRIVDEATLRRIASRDAVDIEVRLIAAIKCRDQLVLAQMAREHPQEGRREDAIKSITDPAILKTIAIDHRSTTAVMQITDQNVLEEIALSSAIDSVRRVAAERITDQAILERVVTGPLDSGIRHICVSAITSQDILTSLALNDKCILVRHAAISGLTDETVLAGIAQKALQETDNLTLHCVASRTKNQELIVEILLSFTYVNEANLESKRLTDSVWSRIVERVTDQSLLARIASERYSLCSDALFCMTDVALLGKIARTHDDIWVRRAAEERLAAAERLAALGTGPARRS